MITTESSITKEMTPVEAANLLVKLEDGHQAAWLATHDVPWPSAEYESRFQNAAEVDDVFRDVTWETVKNGMRLPGEPVEEFAERAESEARLAIAREGGVETAAGPITQQAGAGMTPEHPRDNQGETAARLQNDANTPEGQACARAFSDTAASCVRELGARHPLPEPDRTPAAPSPSRRRRPSANWRPGHDNRDPVPGRPAMRGTRSTRDRHLSLPRQTGHESGRDDPPAQPRRPIQARLVPRAGEGAGAMTDITIRTRAGIAARVSAWIGRRQRELSDRVHAAGDAVAREHGWTVTATTGWFGFGARSYRDPRFDNRRQQLSLSGHDAAMPPVRRRSGRPENQEDS